ncbi:MAG TPA: hypothetical protein VMN43_00810, partial [Aestuariivirgaceae bacterium]|nr:hypothetical protein [Aestuariivirgaceae bacterium]
MSQKGRQAKQARRAKRDLERMGEQSEKLLGAGSSDPPDPTEDRIEIIGRRIGRALGYLIGAVLVIHLLA